MKNDHDVLSRQTEQSDESGKRDLQKKRAYKRKGGLAAWRACFLLSLSTCHYRAYPVRHHFPFRKIPFSLPVPSWIYLPIRYPLTWIGPLASFCFSWLLFCYWLSLPHFLLFLSGFIWHRFYVIHVSILLSAFCLCGVECNRGHGDRGGVDNQVAFRKRQRTEWPRK